MTTEKFKTTLVRNSFCIRLECSSSTCSSRGASLKPRRAPSRLPIVFAQTIDPIGNGFIERMSRPGGNITGFTQFEYVLSAKWQELLKGGRASGYAGGCHSRIGWWPRRKLGNGR